MHPLSLISLATALFMSMGFAKSKLFHFFANIRFGEEGASGWLNWMSNQHGGSKNISSQSGLDFVCTLHSDAYETCDIEDKINLNLSKPQQWLEIEQQREKRHWKPWKQTEGSEDCEDPDRTVLVDDVVPSLFKIDPKNSENQIQQILLILLVSIGVPVKVEFFSSYIREKLLSLDITTCEMKGFANSDPFEIVVLNRTVDPSREFSLDLSDSRLCFIERVFSQTLVLGGKYSNNLVNVFSQCWLLFESILFKQDLLSLDKTQLKARRKYFKKFAKSLLKVPANRSCVALWEMFALHENEVGDQDEAVRIFDMLISMCNGQTDQKALINQFCKVFRCVTII